MYLFNIGVDLKFKYLRSVERKNLKENVCELRMNLYLAKQKNLMPANNFVFILFSGSKAVKARQNPLATLRFCNKTWLFMLVLCR